MIGGQGPSSSWSISVHRQVRLFVLMTISVLVGIQIGIILSVQDEAASLTVNNNHTREHQTAAPDDDTIDLGWCPFAKCENSPLCQPCRKRFLLVVAGYRSGSTSMREMMDHLPGIRIGGENRNLIYAIDQLFKNQRDYPFRQPENPVSAWFRYPDRKSDYACMTQTIIGAFYPPEPSVQQNATLLGFATERNVIGFKTIRLHERDWPADEAVQFIRTYLPCTRIIVNVDLGRPKQSENVTRFAAKFGKEQAFLIDTALYKKNASYHPCVERSSKEVQVVLYKPIVLKCGHQTSSSRPH
jgi:hypothetical protein